MKKMLVGLILISTLTAVVALAGEGATKFYGYFHDIDGYDTGSVPVTTKTWIGAHNNNDYPAKYFIKYYRYDGSVFGSYSSTVAAHTTAIWRPQDQISVSPTSEAIKGSYVINVTEGSLTISSSVNSFSGPDIADKSGTNGVSNHLSMTNSPLHTVTSTHMTMDSFNLLEKDGDNMALVNGERNIRMHLMNPDDNTTAEAKIKFYKDGNAAILDPHDDGDDTTKTLTIGPHEIAVVNPGFYNVTSVAGIKQYSVDVDVTKGSLVGGYILYECTTENNIYTHRTLGGSLSKQMIIQ